MQRTRNEIAALLKKSEQNLRRTEEVHRQLRALMLHVDQVLEKKVPVKRKSQK